jgi:small subunit ribosomal protein S16
MLTIRMQRTGRKGHAQFRVIVQDSRFSPTSGRVVAHLGSYNPHSKTTTLNKDKTKSYLDNGAQPSDRVAKLLKAEGVKLPDWVSLSAPKKRPIRNQDKLRRNRPDEPKADKTPAAEAPTEETPATVNEAPAETTPAETEAAPAAEADSLAADETSVKETPAES